jgi:tRNA nucleotidyltransferase (CCA-adding enzyme)
MWRAHSCVPRRDFSRRLLKGCPRVHVSRRVSTRHARVRAPHPMNIFLPDGLERIIRDLRDAGFRAVVVGGAVRDALLGLQPKDFDIEVYGISYDALAAFLSCYGAVDLVGKSFGVVKAGAGVDFSVPRRESKTGAHHRDFHATFDESITPKEAAGRRDFTINAMAYDPLTGELIDFFGGQEDLKNRVLRATSAAFGEDPLRVLRGMQFACRFDLRLDAQTAAECKALASEYGTIAKERIGEEFRKWAEKSGHPGRLIEYLNDSGWMIHFPELHALEGVPQDPDWHPEGDVATHTMLVVDQAVRVADRDSLEGDDRAVLLFAALCHDFAKATTTELRERDGRIRWTSWGHEAASGPMARGFLERIGIKSAIVDQVVPLVENHLAHSNIGDEVSARAVRRLAIRLAPASIAQLMRLIEADASGRPPKPGGLPEGAGRLLEAAQQQAVERKPQLPLILGRHVLPYFDGKPGRHIGEVTAAAYEAQADGVFSTEEQALEWLERYFQRF